MIKPITVFISYAHVDAPYLEELQKYLKPYERKQTILVWTDRFINAGQEWDELIKANLKQSNIVLFLISQDFLASDYINNVEIKNAIENDKLIIIPIIIRPIDMSQLELKSYQVVPTGAEPIAKWKNKDEAWVDVVKELKIVFDKINGVYSQQSDNMHFTKNRNIQSDNFNLTRFSDRILMGISLILIILGIIVLIYGIIMLILEFKEENKLYIFISFPLMGLGFIGYFLQRKLLPS